jgi:hypothetical protein
MSASCIFSLAAIGNAANTSFSSIGYQLEDSVDEKSHTDKSHPLHIVLKSLRLDLTKLLHRTFDQATGGRHEFSGGSLKTLLMEARRRFDLAQKCSRANDGFGSGADENPIPRLRPMLRVKQTFSAE